MAFPYEFLPALPNLQVLHIYSVGRREEKIVRDGFSSMRVARRMGRLMEVRLQPFAVWRRSTVDSEDWCLRLDGGEAIRSDDI